MKAIFFEHHGEADVLKYADLPDPKPSAGQALIKVKACALNHLDIWVRKGWCKMASSSMILAWFLIIKEWEEYKPEVTKVAYGVGV